MITELVFFDLPKGTTRAQALAMYRQTAESWRVVDPRSGLLQEL
jgi:hypothetical protein